MEGLHTAREEELGGEQDRVVRRALGRRPPSPLGRQQLEEDSLFGADTGGHDARHVFGGAAPLQWTRSGVVLVPPDLLPGAAVQEAGGDPQILAVPAEPAVEEETGTSAAPTDPPPARSFCRSTRAVRYRPSSSASSSLRFSASSPTSVSAPTASKPPTTTEGQPSALARSAVAGGAAGPASADRALPPSAAATLRKTGT